MNGAIKNLLSRTETVVTGNEATLVTPVSPAGRTGIHVFNASDTYELGLRAVAVGASAPAMISFDDASIVIAPRATVFLAYASSLAVYAINGSLSVATSRVVVEEAN